MMKSWIIIDAHKAALGRLGTMSYDAAMVVATAYFPDVAKVHVIGWQRLNTLHRRQRQMAREAPILTAALCLARGLVLPAEVWAELAGEVKTAAAGCAE